MNSNPCTKTAFCLTALLWLFSCSPQNPPGQESLQTLLEGTEALAGKPGFLNTPFVAAGDRVYLAGHQDGSFPDLGWHVPGEMGGIWNHPIKLMDGFVASALVNGQVHCLEKADSFVNYPFANKHTYSTAVPGLEITRFQFVPDGLEAAVIEFAFQNTAAQGQHVQFSFEGHTDLRPVWLGERTGMEDAEDMLLVESPEYILAKDGLSPWYVMFGADTPANAGPLGGCAYNPQGQGVSAALGFSFDLQPGKSHFLRFVVAGSAVSLGETKENFAKALDEAPDLLLQKKERYAQLAAQARLTVPDKKLQQAFEWVKYNTDWLIRDVPGIGRGLSAGLPDYPWWFGVDNEYTLLGAIATGRRDLVYSTIELIHGLSEKENGNGRIIHEASTNGAVFNPGNINETPQFASLIWTVYQWTGDRAFLETYYPSVKKGLAWLLDENDADGNLVPDGYGMMEIHGMDSEMTDVAAYTQRAFAHAALIAREMGENEVAKDYEDKAARLAATINSGFWVEEAGSYADFVGTVQQALHLIDGAIVRADTLDKPWAVDELKATKKRLAAYPPAKKQGFVVHHNWVVNTPMETGVADTAKALQALETARRFVNPYGVFVTGIDRDETAGQDEGSFAGSKVFSYTGAVMTLPTGVQAIAENNYGRPDMALDYLQRMTRTFGFALPGAIYEVSPDYGMMVQAWNLYSYAVPIVTQFFGIRPSADQKTVEIRPQMPTAWNDALLENISVGNNLLSVAFVREANSCRLTVDQQEEDWVLRLSFPKGKYSRWELNGEVIQPTDDGGHAVFAAKGRRLAFVLTEAAP